MMCSLKRWEWTPVVLYLEVAFFPEDFFIKVVIGCILSTATPIPTFPDATSWFVRRSFRLVLWEVQMTLIMAFEGTPPNATSPRKYGLNTAPHQEMMVVWYSQGSGMALGFGPINCHELRWCLWQRWRLQVGLARGWSGFLVCSLSNWKRWTCRKGSFQWTHHPNLSSRKVWLVTWFID